MLIHVNSQRHDTTGLKRKVVCLYDEFLFTTLLGIEVEIVDHLKK